MSERDYRSADSREQAGLGEDLKDWQCEHVSLSDNIMWLLQSGQHALINSEKGQ